LRSCKSPASREEMIVELAERAEPKHLADNHEEQLGLLLRTDEVRRYSPGAAAELVDKFFLRRLDTFKQIKAEIFNTYILVAILLDLPQLLTQLCRMAVDTDWNRRHRKYPPQGESMHRRRLYQCIFLAKPCHPPWTRLVCKSFCRTWGGCSKVRSFRTIASPTRK
jgi:hypothetical protein